MDKEHLVVSEKHIRIEQNEPDAREGLVLSDARVVLSDASRIIRESEHIEHHIKHTESSGFTLEISRVTMDTSRSLEGSPLRSGMEASFGSTEGAEDINWKERCHTLEASLHKFKNRAAQIRELLAAKVSRNYSVISRARCTKNFACLLVFLYPTWFMDSSAIAVGLNVLTHWPLGNLNEIWGT